MATPNAGSGFALQTSGHSGRWKISKNQLANRLFMRIITTHFEWNLGRSVQGQYKKTTTADSSFVSCWLSCPRGGIGRRARFRF